MMLSPKWAGDDRTRSWHYDGGKEVASFATLPQKSPELGFVVPTDIEDAKFTNFPVAPPPFEEAGKPSGLPDSPAGSSSRRGDEKADVRVLGKGHLKVFQRLLEVAPLRSKTTGSMGASDVFPLPTSRSMVSLFFPNLDDDVLGWYLCVAVSLNSFWGGPFF